MKNKMLIVITASILTISAVTVAYAKENNRTNSFAFRGSMMYQNNSDSYNQMIDLMRKNGFDDAANAMENRDFNAMQNFMNNLTDEQYNQMIDIMRQYGYTGMARMMGSVGRQGMLNMHNSMMGR